jgi:transcription elongation factor
VIVLREAAAARSVGAAERARRALVELGRRGETITFAVVAARASVSRQFLYSHADLRADIERLRGPAAGAAAATGATARKRRVDPL